MQGRLRGREAEGFAGGGPKPCMDGNSDHAGGGSQLWCYGQRRNAVGGDLAAEPTSEAQVTPELFPVDRSGWKAAPDTKPAQLKIDLPESSWQVDRSQPSGDDELSLRPEAGSPQ